jgi:hypothetical protein
VLIGCFWHHYTVTSASCVGKIERITKPLLYQLSYVGTSGKDDIRGLREQARRF